MGDQEFGVHAMPMLELAHPQGSLCFHLSFLFNLIFFSNFSLIPTVDDLAQ